MKGKENQFEELEMARDIHEALLYCKGNSHCRNCEFKNDTSMSFCKAEYIAKAISKKYQPKISKDSVVLSADEFANLKKYTYKKGSKEMAEKIMQDLKPLLEGFVHTDTGENLYVYKCKQFDVEIKE